MSDVRRNTHTQNPKLKRAKLVNLSPKCQSQRINFLNSGGRKQTGAAENKAKLNKRTVWELMPIIITKSRCVALPREVWHQSVNTIFTLSDALNRSRPETSGHKTPGWSNKTDNWIPHSPYYKWPNIKWSTTVAVWNLGVRIPLCISCHHALECGT